MAVPWPHDPKAHVVMRCNINCNDIHARSPFQYVHIHDTGAMMTIGAGISLRDFRALHLGVSIHPQHYTSTTYFCPYYRKWMTLPGMLFGFLLACYHCLAVSIEAVMAMRSEAARVRQYTKGWTNVWKALCTAVRRNGHRS